MKPSFLAGMKPSFSAGKPSQRVSSVNRAISRELGLKIGGDPMPHLFGLADAGQQREHCFDQPALFSRTATTEFEGRRVARLGVEASIAEQHGARCRDFDRGMEQAVIGIGGSPDPADDLSQVIHRLAALGADSPAMIGNACPSKLLRAATPTHRMDQFHAVVIGEAEQAWLGQEPSAPNPLRLQASKQRDRW